MTAAAADDAADDSGSVNERLDRLVDVGTSLLDLLFH